MLALVAKMESRVEIEVGGVVGNLPITGVYVPIDSNDILVTKLCVLTFNTKFLLQNKISGWKESRVKD